MVFLYNHACELVVFYTDTYPLLGCGLLPLSRSVIMSELSTRKGDKLYPCSILDHVPPLVVKQNVNRWIRAVQAGLDFATFSGEEQQRHGHQGPAEQTVHLW